MTHWPFVSVLVVNFNGRKFLGECLWSLANQSYPRDRFEVIVVDNASGDGSVEFVREQLPWVKLIESKKNLGFAAGNNAGFEMAHGDWIALLNNDAVAEREWLATSIKAGVTQPTIGGVASHIVFHDDPDRINSTGLILLRDGRGADRDFGCRADQVKRPRGEVFGGCGAGLVLRREMLDELGLFDPKLFMYYEDLDLAWRAQRIGWRFVYEPTARVRHVFGASAGVASPLQTRYVERNRCLVNLRYAPLPVAIGTVLGAVARVVRTMCRAMTTKNVTWRYVVGHLQAIGSVAMMLPSEVWQRMARTSSTVPRRDGNAARRAA